MAFKMRHLGVLLGALLISMLCIHSETDAQKTAQRWSSASASNARGSGTQSVYGGYQASSSEQTVEQVQQQQQQPQRPVRPIAPAKSPSRRVQSSSSYQASQSVSRGQVNRPQPLPVYQQQESSYESQASSLSGAAEADAEPASYGSVDGKPGQDFPSYTRVPKTSFSCAGLPHNEYGMYADVETGCQAYHICHNGRKDSFLCGPGTVFNQRILHCDYWYSVDCASSSQYYASSNAYMGSSQPEPGPAQAGPPVQVQREQSASSSYQRTVSRPGAPPPPPPSKFQQQAASSFSRDVQQVEESY